MRKILTVSLTVILLSLFVVTIVFIEKNSRGINKSSIASIKEKGELVVAMDVNLPGYFTFYGEPYGFQYDILKSFADFLEVDLTVVPQKSVNNARKMLDRGEVDMVVAMSKYAEESSLKYHLLEPVYVTEYVVLGNKKKLTDKKVSSDNLKEVVKNNNVVLTQGFTATKAYNRWLDSVSNTAVISYANALNLIASLDKGDIDFLVCEKLEGELGCHLYNNVKNIYNFGEEVASVMFVGRAGDGLESSFNNWVAAFRDTEDYAALHALYYENDFLRQVVQQGYVKPLNGISPFDDIIKREADSVGRDWRLVSAIAYHESRFNPNVVSRRGAQGIMQVMPSIAEQFDISVDELMEPEKNIKAALKLMDEIEALLHFSPGTSEYDKLCIILACYNGGIGHVLDARRLARKYGEDPNAWENIAKYLDKKSDARYYLDESVKNGKFHSNETLAFVQKVMKSYNQYCNQIQ